MDEKKIARINELYHKSKAEGLTEKEKKEQQILRREYIEAFKMSLRGQLNIRLPKRLRSRPFRSCKRWLRRTKSSWLT